MERALLIIVLGLFVLVGAPAGCMYGWPQYRVWEQRMQGEAELARASQNRQIAEFDAKAKIMTAQGEAQAEIERAKGNAQANKIIAEGLGGPKGYLEYLYIDALKNHSGATIYVPTEVGLPILEARTPPAR